MIQWQIRKSFWTHGTFIHVGRRHSKLTNEYIKADFWIVKASAKKLRQVNMLGSG